MKKLTFIFIYATACLALRVAPLGAQTAPEPPGGAPGVPDHGRAPAAGTGEPSADALPDPEPTPTSAGPSGPTIDLPPEGELAASPQSPSRPAQPTAVKAVASSPAPQTIDTELGGYAELHYTRAPVTGPGDAQSTIDLARVVLFVSHRFDERLRFYSEIEIEHAVASSDRAGEVEMEQAYLDFLLAGRALGLRAGLVLVPMGIINKWHEPPVFHGVDRPSLDTLIIPSTWREGGVGVFGEPIEGLRYELYLMSGLDPRGFSASQGIREGRQEVSLARADGLALSGRVEAEPVLGTVLGISGYVGRAGPNAELYDLGGRELDLGVPVWGSAADARFRRDGLEARAIVAVFGAGDTAELRHARDADGHLLGIDTAALLWGGYGEVAYDLLRLIIPTSQQLLPFVRLERYDTMAVIRGRARVPSDDSYAVTEVVAGLSYRPLRQVAFKADFGLRNPDGPVPSSGRIDLGVGVMF